MSEPQVVINTQTVATTKPATNTCGLISLILACVSFVINPLSLLPTVAFILGVVGLIVGLCNHKPVGTSIAGLLIAIFTGVVQLVVDLILAIPTLGLSFFI